MVDEMTPAQEDKIYQRGYSMGYAARGRKSAATNRAEVARQVRATFAGREQVNFDAPAGKRLTLLVPQELTSEDLAYFREVVEPYLDLLAKRLAEQAAQPAQAGADRVGG